MVEEVGADGDDDMAHCVPCCILFRATINLKKTILGF
jgi:hypothetical protein